MLQPGKRIRMATRKSKPRKRQRGQKMTDAQLLSAIDYREEKSEPGERFEAEQRNALAAYFGAKLGNEVDGRSQLVMREVYSVIEWIKPALMKIFFGSERVLEFTPLTGNDVLQAEQETQYIDHVIQKRNDGFTTLMSWFSDGMLAKNGYVLAYYDRSFDVSEDTYENVDIDTLTLIGEENDITVIEQEEDGTDEYGEPTYRIKVREKTENGQVRIKPIPPERVRVDAAHGSVSLRNARYVRYRENKTISELREEGFEVSDDLNDNGDDVDNDQRMQDVRRQTSYINGRDKDEDEPDPASREVDVDTCWIRIDYDGDGIAELRRVIRVGNTILYNEVDGSICLYALTPTIVAHRHQGLSIADAVIDLQEAKTIIVRGYLDNIGLANNGRYFIDDDRVNLDDMLVSRPGGVVRVTGGVANAVQPFQHPILGGAIIQAAEYLDNTLENRTGASPRVLQGQSFDGDAINRTATGISTVMSNVMSRIELIARIFAETGVQDLYRGVHELTLKYKRKKDVFEVTGNYVEVDPTMWVNRDHMTINIGSINKQEQIQMLQMIITAQQAMAQVGLATPENVYYALTKLTRIAGFKDVDRYWTKPQQAQQPGGQGDPKVAAEAAKAQADSQAKMAEIEVKKLGIDADVQMARMKSEDAQLATFVDSQVKLALAQMQSDDNARQAGMEITNDPGAPNDDQGKPSMEDMIGAVLAKLHESNNKPRPVRVVHHHDAAGNLTHSEPVYE